MASTNPGQIGKKIPKKIPSKMRRPESKKDPVRLDEAFPKLDPYPSSLDRALFHPSSSPSSPDFNTLATGASTWPTSGIPGSGWKSRNSSLWKNASLRLKRAVSSPPKLRSDRPPSVRCRSSSLTHVAWVRRTDTFG